MQDSATLFVEYFRTKPLGSAVGQARPWGLVGVGKEQPALEKWRDSRFWRLGVFYVNPADERVFVPRRSGIGDTLNLAQPAAWVVVALLASLPILVVVLIALVTAHAS